MRQITEQRRHEPDCHSKIRPWDQPFWKSGPHKGAVLFYLALIHLLAIIGLLLFPLPSPKVFGIAFVLAALGGFGVTVCYHRPLAHRTLRLNKFVELLLSICCGLVFGWQGFFWIGAIRLVYALHMQCFINSLTHLDHSEERDSSKNICGLARCN